MVKMAISQSALPFFFFFHISLLLLCSVSVLAHQTLPLTPAPAPASTKGYHHHHHHTPAAAMPPAAAPPKPSPHVGNPPTHTPALAPIPHHHHHHHPHHNLSTPKPPAAAPTRPLPHQAKPPTPSHSPAPAPATLQPHHPHHNHHHHQHTTAPSPAPATPHHPTPPSHAPIPPPSQRKQPIAVCGSVFCRSCKNSTIPIKGAVVKLECKNTKKEMEERTETDEKGYFLLKPRIVTSAGWHKCRVFLVSSPHRKCNVPTNHNLGRVGAPLNFNRPENKTLSYPRFTVGPFFFKHYNQTTHCKKHLIG